MADRRTAAPVPFTPSHFLSLQPPALAANHSKPRRRSTKAGSTAGLKALSTLILADVASRDEESWLEKKEKELKEWAAQTARFARKAGGWRDDGEDTGSDALSIRSGSSISPIAGPSNVRLPPGDPLDLPTPPPSPSRFPGAWPYSAPQERDGFAGLSLPPPFLDEYSTAESFEGLLGIRRQRQVALKRQRLERQLARDRPPDPPFPRSLITTAGKLVGALGPPGGLYSSSAGDTQERRRRREGERALKGFEVGDKWAGEVARRLRRTASTRYPDASEPSRGLEPQPESPPRIEVDIPRAHRALTPASIFANETSSSSSSSASTPQPTASPGSRPTLPFPHNVSLPIVRPPAPRLGPISNGPPTSFLHLNSSALFSPLTLDDTENHYAASPSSRSSARAAVTSPSGPHRPAESSDDDYFKPKLRYRRRKGLQWGAASGPSVPTVTATPAPTIPTTEVIVHAAATEGQRRLDMLIIFLVGSSEGDSESLLSVGGLLGALLWLVGFAFFVCVHLASLAWSASRAMKAGGLFLYWIAINLAGKTDFSQVAMSYYRLCRQEWDKVAQEDGEVLGVWSLCLGLAELAAIQSMTRARCLSDSSAIDLIDTAFGPLPPPGKGEPSDTESLGASPPLTPFLPNFTRGRSERHRGTGAGSGEGEQLIISGEGGAVVEGTVFTPEAEASNPFSAATSLLSGNDAQAMSPLSIDGAVSALDAEANLPSPPMTPLILPSPQSRKLSLARFSAAATPMVELPDMLRSLKRHARLATASYGLHSYILHPPTPMFTPSGASLPNSIFSHLSKIDDRSSIIHVAIQKDYAGAWGNPSASTEEKTSANAAEEDEWQPTVFVVRDHINREVVVVFRGTQSLHDIVTDLQAEDEELVLPSLADAEKTEIFKMHGGILRAVSRMFEPKAALFEKVRTVLEEHRGYGLVFTGHSLGAACASTAAIILSKATRTSSGQNQTAQTWSIAEGTGLPSRPIRAVCFAPPTTVDTKLAARCAQGVPLPLVISITLSSDIICRIGAGQIKELRRALGRLAKLRRGFLKRPSQAGDVELEQHGQTSVLRDWWKLRSLSSSASPSTSSSSAGPSKEVRRIEDAAWRIRQQMLSLSSRADESMIPPGMVFHIDRLPDPPPRQQPRNEDSANAEEEPSFGFYHVRDPRLFFALPWLDSDLVSSHLPQCYLDAIESI